MASQDTTTSRYPLIKQIAATRRKPDMTHKEFLDYHYQVHGSIADAPEDPNLKPYKYIQSHVFDSAFGARKPPTGGKAPPNANHPWVGRDDATELWFKDLDHMLHNFGSEHVRTTVGPDALHFADLGASINLMAFEKPLPLTTDLGEGAVKVDEAAGRHATTALYFVALPGGERDGAQAEKIITPLLREALEAETRQEVWKWVVNVGLTIPEFDPSSYFGGADLPKYALVYKIYLKDPTAIGAFRKAQKVFEKQEKIDVGNSFVLFTKEVLVASVADGFSFDKTHQPVFNDIS
ncbi:Dimeric alpha-beta barrel [Lasiodiplodia theobromae]|uniref:EthD domain-containing protein n=1 Tax=Lasiodiplodia theobromae TaxID=45133 RepID=A0A5N5DJ18_9PEZI|nr:Dimeric alpha-beta barrel [Lasiodiplodia theobromae]KAB2577873.1 hypothetical protein DBV05_g3503 [Lasiodiplodia theobromae]KAF4537109.1 Dimeric alpha-beta barrel [Lasiodiplodia theobromae]